MVNLEQSLVTSRRQTRERLAPRGFDYVVLLRALEYSRYPLGRDRGKMVEADYLWMREVDDVVDGHLPLPAGYTTTIDYAQRKIEYLQAPSEPTDLAEELIVLCKQLSQKTGIELDQEREAIVGSMLFDAKRRGTGEIFPAAVLNEYFYRLDIEGTIRGALKIFGEDPEKTQYLEALGYATRIHYNLTGFEEDIEKGLVNISQEDCDQFGITPADLLDIHSPSVQAWFRHEAARGQVFLAEHHDHVGEANFGRVGRMILPIVYERPARKFFEQILN